MCSVSLIDGHIDEPTMTDEDVVKALECCIDTDILKSCKELGCPLKKHCRKDVDALDKACLDLINRQKADYKQETERLAHYMKMLDYSIEERNKLRAEVKRLQYVLMGVMYSVDKWLEGDELKQDEVNRAAIMREKTLQIVEKQKAEIDILIRKKETLQDEVAELKAKNERLKAEIRCGDNALALLDRSLFEVKAEAIKEFAERLKEKATSTFFEERKYVDTEDIDNLVKEMVGE